MHAIYWLLGHATTVFLRVRICDDINLVSGAPEHKRPRVGSVVEGAQVAQSSEA